MSGGWTGLVVCLGVSLLFAGCSTAASDPPARDDLTIAAAKEIAQSAELKVASQLPAAAVIEIDQRHRGSLLGCRGERNFRWAGGTSVRIAPNTDMAGLVDDLSAAVSVSKGWSAGERRSSAFGEPRITVAGPQDEWVIVTADARSDSVDLSSISPCFHLRDDESPHGFY